MKLLPFAMALSCAALVAGCGRQAATESDAEKQHQEQLTEEQQAQILSALHEREAALDERDRLLTEREQQLAPASASPSQAQQSVPPPVASGPAAAPAPAASAAPDVTYQEFYNALSPYGSWVQMPGYDYVWQPLATVQDNTWRPYTLGHWVYTDDGWTWLSEEPFGWLTYHYGRWMRTHTLGWVWVPGDQWAPAWVSWRYGNNYVGWAPLPPEAQFDGATGIQQWADQQYDLGASDYTFVPATDFGEGNMADVEVPPDENGSIYDDSNNETNIYYDAGAYAIICYGPNYDFMRSKSRRPLQPPLTLSRYGYRAGGNNGAAVSGNRLSVTAPRIVPSRRQPAAPQTFHRVADSRFVAPAAPQPLLGTASQPRFAPPQVNTIPRPAATPVPPQLDAAPIPQTRPEVAESNAPAPPENARPPANRIPAEPNPVPRAPSESNPAPPPADTQNDRDRELIQQQQLERERQAEAAQAADQARQAEEARAADAARAEREASDEQAARAAREEQAARDEAATRAVQSQPVSAPAGSPGPMQGRP
jgi:hypothetical protein